MSAWDDQADYQGEHQNKAGSEDNAGNDKVGWLTLGEVSFTPAVTLNTKSRGKNTLDNIEPTQGFRICSIIALCHDVVFRLG